MIQKKTVCLVLVSSVWGVCFAQTGFAMKDGEWIALGLASGSATATTTPSLGTVSLAGTSVLSALFLAIDVSRLGKKSLLGMSSDTGNAGTTQIVGGLAKGIPGTSKETSDNTAELPVSASTSKSKEKTEDKKAALSDQLQVVREDAKTYAQNLGQTEASPVLRETLELVREIAVEVHCGEVLRASDLRLAQEIALF